MLGPSDDSALIEQQDLRFYPRNAVSALQGLFSSAIATAKAQMELRRRLSVRGMPDGSAAVTPQALSTQLCLRTTYSSDGHYPQSPAWCTCA